MEETLDFSSANIDDFKLGGSEPAQQDAPEVQPTEVKSEPVVSQQAETVEAAPAESKQTPDYNFKDDFIKGVVEFYEKTGDLTPYLQAKTVDFTQMSDEEILRKNLREQYSDLSEKAFDRLFKQQVVDKFKLDADEWGEEDSELGRELLKVEAAKVRDQYLQWQKNFQAPEPEATPELLQAQEMLQKFEQEVRSSDYTKNILEGKKLTIKTADGEFNYELSQPETMLDMTIDNDRFFSQFANDQGQLDYNKWYKTVAYSQNPELFEKALINYGKTLGRSEVTKEIKNPSNASVGEVPTEGSGDFRTGLLQAFANRGISK
jgi:hypothetical protein